MHQASFPRREFQNQKVWESFQKVEILKKTSHEYIKIKFEKNFEENSK